MKVGFVVNDVQTELPVYTTVRLAMAAMGQPETKVGDLCKELGITRQTLYRHVSPKGELRPDGLPAPKRSGIKPSEFGKEKRGSPAPAGPRRAAPPPPPP